MKNSETKKIKKFFYLYDGSSSFYRWLLFFQRFYWRFSTKESIRRFIYFKKILERFKEIHNIILFGSLCFGQAVQNSDFEIVIVYRERKNPSIERKIIELTNSSFKTKIDFSDYFFVYNDLMDIINGKNKDVGFLAWFYNDYTRGLPIKNYPSLIEKTVAFAEKSKIEKIFFINTEKKFFNKRSSMYKESFKKYNERIIERIGKLPEEIIVIQESFFKAISLEDLNKKWKKLIKKGILNENWLKTSKKYIYLT